MQYVSLFNRHMHSIRTMVTSPGIRIGRVADKETDDIIGVGWITHGLGIENIGRCGSIASFVPNPGHPGPVDLSDAIDRTDWRNCVETPVASHFRTPDAATAVVSIRDEPGDWSEQ